MTPRQPYCDVAHKRAAPVATERGSPSRQRRHVDMGPLATTRMACQPEMMKREQQFLTMLFAELTHLKLNVDEDKHNVLAELIRRDFRLGGTGAFVC
jgi:hypothetical protein